jgi:hypothetical protein
MEQLDRAINILKNPVNELSKVKSEQISSIDLIKQYIAILALIPAIAYIIGQGIVGFTTMFGSFKIPIWVAFAGGVFTYLLSVAAVYINSFVINTLAPNFDSRQDENRAMKLAAYSATPGLIGGIFNIIPAISIIAIIFAIYGLYILYLGLPVLMESPEDKKIIYTIVIIVVSMVVYFIIGAIISSIVFSMSPIGMGRFPVTT